MAALPDLIAQPTCVPEGWHVPSCTRVSKRGTLSASRLGRGHPFTDLEGGKGVDDRRDGKFCSFCVVK